MIAGAEGLVARAPLWQWTARAFWYPEPAFLADLRKRTVWRQLADCAGLVGPTEVQAALAHLRQATNARADSRLSLPEEHTFLFARQVPTSLHGSSYAAARGADRAQELAKVGGFYAAFGFQVADGRRELPDHISLELEFVAALLVKEAYALTQGWDDRAAVTQAARRRFLEEHLGCWLPWFAERLRQHARLTFYPAAADLVLALLATEAPAALAPGSRGPS